MSVVGWVSAIVEVDVAVADERGIGSVLADVRRVRGWLDSVEVVAAARLNELAVLKSSMFPERVVGDAARIGLGEASRRLERAKTVQTIPALGGVLVAGETSAGHVDVVTRAMRDLTSEQRTLLAGRGDVLARAAGQLGRDDFARHVRAEVRRVCADNGIERLERQRRATRLRTWIDRETGMWCLRGDYDPETGLLLDRKLQTMLDTLFHETPPATCPVDPLSKQEHLRALALVALCEGKAGRTRTEVTVLIDAETLHHGQHEHSSVDLGVDLDLPVETVRRMACCADVIVPVLTAANGINLHLGREKRLASRHQRRLLRVMYRTCAIPGCDVTFDKCQIHHLHWYGKHHGPTDIDQELPLCHRHHHCVHEGGWNLQLDRHRNLTITQPNSTTMTTGPPTRRTG